MHARNVFFQTRDDKARVRESKQFFLGGGFQQTQIWDA